MSAIPFFCGFDDIQCQQSAVYGFKFNCEAGLDYRLYIMSSRVIIFLSLQLLKKLSPNKCFSN